MRRLCKASAPPARLRYCCCTLQGVGGETSLDRLLYLQAALLSAREHAPSLVPLLIYSGAGSGGQGGDNVTAWFEANGGHVVHHTLSFLPDFQRQPNATWRELLLRAEASPEGRSPERAGCLLAMSPMQLCPG